MVGILNLFYFWFYTKTLKLSKKNSSLLIFYAFPGQVISHNFSNRKKSDTKIVGPLLYGLSI